MKQFLLLAAFVSVLLIFGCAGAGQPSISSAGGNPPAAVQPTQNSGQATQTQPEKTSTTQANTAPTQCTDGTCFFANLAACTPTSWNTDLYTQGVQEFTLQIVKEEGDNCIVQTTIVKMSAQLNGKGMICQVNKAERTKDEYLRAFSPIGSKVLSECTGSYVDAIKQSLGTGNINVNVSG